MLIIPRLQRLKHDLAPKAKYAVYVLRENYIELYPVPK